MKRDETNVALSVRRDGRLSGRIQIIGWSRADVLRLARVIKPEYPVEADALTQCVVDLMRSRGDDRE